MRHLAATLVAAIAQQLAPTASAQAESRTVAPLEQLQRDAERLHILRNELEREQQAVADAARRRARHLADGDERGAKEAELARVRASDNVAALKREMASTARTEPASRPRSTPNAIPVAPPAWWDVYAGSKLAAQRTSSEPAQPRQP